MEGGKWGKGRKRELRKGRDEKEIRREKVGRRGKADKIVGGKYERWGRRRQDWREEK